MRDVKFKQANRVKRRAKLSTRNTEMEKTVNRIARYTYVPTYLYQLGINSVGSGYISIKRERKV